MRFTVIGGSGGSTIAINNGSSTLPSLSGAYAISGSGSVMQLDGVNPYVITSRGVSPLTQSGGASGTSGQFTFSGSGSGHNVGLSQWGSVAMAQQGYSYRDILQFYYTGVTIR
jgi:stage II sporulation protein D